MSTRSKQEQSPDSYIPLSVPFIGDLEKSYVNECLDTGWVSSAGQFVKRFEEAVRNQVGRKYAVAVTSGTAALHLALVISGIEPDDEVLVPSLTFIAPANAVRYTGAHPVLIDADPHTWQMDPTLVESFLRDGCYTQHGTLVNRETGRRIRGILPVHVLGHPVDMNPIEDIAAQFDITVIEDATEALGSTYKDSAAGSRGDVSCLSFNGNKIITCGGGGMLLTDDSDRAELARHLSTQAKSDPVRYVHNAIGYNYRLTNVQAALGLGQLGSLDERVAKRRETASVYQDAFREYASVSFMPEASWARSNRWLSAIILDPNLNRHAASDVIKGLAERRIETRPLWQPLQDGAPHRGALAIGGSNARLLHERSICLPSSFQLKDSEQERVIETIFDLLQHQ